VKHVAMVHGGYAEVESRTDANHGSTFRIRMPLTTEGRVKSLPLADATPLHTPTEHDPATLPTSPSPARRTA
jgi:hypothetical protein